MVVPSPCETVDCVCSSLLGTYRIERIRAYACAESADDGIVSKRGSDCAVFAVTSADGFGIREDAGPKTLDNGILTSLIADMPAAPQKKEPAAFNIGSAGLPRYRSCVWVASMDETRRVSHQNSNASRLTTAPSKHTACQPAWA
jgi:hypothetical protein